MQCCGVYLRRGPAVWRLSFTWPHQRTFCVNCQPRLVRKFGGQDRRALAQGGGQSPACGPVAHPPEPPGPSSPQQMARCATAGMRAGPAARPAQNGTRRPPQRRRAAETVNVNVSCLVPAQFFAGSARAECNVVMARRSPLVLGGWRRWRVVSASVQTAWPSGCSRMAVAICRSNCLICSFSAVIVATRLSTSWRRVASSSSPIRASGARGALPAAARAFGGRCSARGPGILAGGLLQGRERPRGWGSAQRTRARSGCADL